VLRVKTLLAAAVVVLLLVTLVAPAGAEQPFTVPTERSGIVPPDRAPTVVRSMNVLVATGQLTERSRSLRLTIFDNRTLDLALDRIEPIPGKGLVWHGKVANEPRSSVTLALIGQTVTGNIDTEGGKAYQLRYVGDGVHSFREIDRTKFPDEGRPRRVDLGTPPAAPDPGPCTDPPTEIDAMVVYTSGAKAAAGGNDAMEGNIYVALAETNESYMHSNINQRLRLVHVEEVTYNPSGAVGTDLTKLQHGSDGELDNVQMLRNAFAADTVTLVVERADNCGLGYLMTASWLSHAFEPYAYSVVRLDCLTGIYSFAHELGHNMGADHDPVNAIGGGGYPYNYGFLEMSPTAPATPWRTVMSLETMPSSARVLYWSNPNVNYAVGGDPMGDAVTADNHRVLNDTAPIVANFRCSSPGAPNVWMKDTWKDTGLEPDAGTAGEEMWKSPYIWVRNAQDTNLIHQHQHENPLVTSPNWVYVKMHNGGASAASGNLELYWADASTSLTWPGGWTLLSSVPVTTGFPSHLAKIVEVPWSSVPGVGHYCLLARWNSATDAMATPEGPDIDANVRANNNLAWRNLHIVELLAAMSTKVSIKIMNPDKENRSIGLVIRSPEVQDKASFLDVGEVNVEFDDVLLEAWRAGGAQGSGFSSEGGRIIVGRLGARFDNVVLPYSREGRLDLTFRRLPATPKLEYRVDIVQRRPAPFARARKLSEVVGGVSYEIHTDRDYIRR
jgi:hypothetical protein